MNTAKLIVACLKANGVTRVFGVPGEENTDMMLALEAADIDFVMTRHEQSAAAMAGTVGRLTGQPGICLATLGPGASNLATGLGTAYLDYSPVIALTGQGNRNRLHKESHQIIDTLSLLAPVSKWSREISSADIAPELIAEAFRQATSERPGPVHLTLPEDVAAVDAHDDLSPILARPAISSVPGDTVIDEAVETIARARKPLVLAGNGVVRNGRYAALRSLSSALGICVATTMMAKGVINPNDEHCLFTFGTMNNSAIKDAITDADCIITVGLDPVEIAPADWGHNPSASIIHIASVPAQFEANYQPTVELVGDIAFTLEQITFALNERMIVFDRSMFADHRKAIVSERREDADIWPHPRSVVHSLRKAIDDKAHVYVGVGAHKMWMAEGFEASHPSGSVITNGFASMGMAFPAAMAAAQAVPDADIFAVCGDGDFLMNVQEMETAKRLNSNITIIGWFDDSYGLIRHKQESDRSEHSQLSLGNPDWSQLAQSFGWHHVEITDEANVHRALQQCKEHKGPSLCVIAIDSAENAAL